MLQLGFSFMSEIPAPREQHDIATFDVLGVPISVVTPLRAAEAIEHWAQDRVGRYVCTRDVASFVAIIEDPSLASIHDSAALITPDGMPLALIGRWRGLPVSRTCGPDLMELVLARSGQTGLKHYFYGGKPGIAARLADRFERKYRGIEVAGHESPPFHPEGSEQDGDAIRRIAASGADVVWIGMSSPRQDIWMRAHYRDLPQTLIGVGAAFDFHAGTIRRAPLLMQRIGFEWLYRLVREPRRLWRRYLLRAPKFLLLLLRQKLMRGRAPTRDRN